MADGKNTDPIGSTIQTALPESIRQLLGPSLRRLTAGLPKHELNTIIQEALACESALEKEIEILERELGIKPEKTSKKQKVDSNKEKKDKAFPSSQLKEPTMISIPQLPAPYQPGGGPINYLDSVDAMLATEFAPPDRYFTVSALIGRLRDPLKLPHPPNASAMTKGSSGVKASSVGGGESGESEQEKKRKRSLLDKQQALLLLESNEIYHQEQPDNAALLALWKRITSHRSAAVFRRPVDPAEAPGYTERILFPIDLSLVRKMIVTRLITSFAALHQRIGLICHNCVKFNGRESDYAVLTREFESYVDDSVVAAVRNASEAAAAAAGH